MNDAILIGRQEKILAVSAENWHKHLAQAQEHPAAVLSFMTREHHRVRNFTVSQLPRNHGLPIRAQDISQQLQLPLATVITILDDLQQHLFFLVQNTAGEVSWAFPVTSEKTPHRL
ncbi:MAG TPA: hypothetical protein VIY29_22210, partial [Ktedonobacteraceae bacterium]